MVISGALLPLIGSLNSSKVLFIVLRDKGWLLGSETALALISDLLRELSEKLNSLTRKAYAVYTVSFSHKLSWKRNLSF